MPVEFKDYYRVLGVTREASDAEIKKAYRKLAGLYHPDVAKDKSAGDAKFKEVNEANEVLSDPEKRRKYDELGAQWDQPGRTASPGGHGEQPAGGEYHFEGTGFSDFFEQFFGSRGRASGGFGPTSAGGRGAARHGQDIEGDILVTLDEVLQGASRTIKLQRTDPETGRTTAQTLQVRIPAGVREGQLIRLSGQGQEGLGGGRAGHLYLRVAFARHRDFRVRGAHLYHDLELTPWEAVLGAHIRIPTLDGTVSLRIPPGTVAGRDFRLRGLGLPAGPGERGDLHAVVSIQVPPDVTPEQRAGWEKLAAGSTFNPRTDP
jgi:curved DNA-binding protein